MTLGGSLVSLFPAAMIAASVAALGLFAAQPSVWTALLFFAVIYLLAPVVFRIHNAFLPLKEGVTRLDGPDYSPWWAAHQFQLFYDALPFLESLLRILPGWYSMWLRLWGARVGYGVHWTPRVEIVDRPLLEIGNRVVFGHKVECYSHLIRVKNDAMKLLVRKIRIGQGAFLGAGARLGPGAQVPAGAMVPTLTDIGVNQTFGAEAAHRNAEEAAMAREE